MSTPVLSNLMLSFLRIQATVDPEAQNDEIFQTLALEIKSVETIFNAQQETIECLEKQVLKNNSRKLNYESEFG